MGQKGVKGRVLDQKGGKWREWWVNKWVKGREWWVNRGLKG